MVAILRQYATQGNLEAFYEWLVRVRKVSEATAKEYVSSVNRPFRETRNTQKAYRLFAKFLASQGVVSEEFADKVLRAIKVKHTEADLYVPTV